MSKKETNSENEGSNALWHSRVYIIALLGLVCYLLTYPLAYVFIPERIPEKFLHEIGTALIIAAFVAFLLDKMVHESLLSNVDRSIDKIRKGSDILDGSSHLGIEDIVARHEPNIRVRWQRKIQRAIENQLKEKSGEILVACVAAPEFFRHDSVIGKVLWDGFTDVNISQPSSCSLRVLLLKLDSKWTDLRVKLEPGHPTKSDIIASLIYLGGLKKERNDKIFFQCYDFPPIAFLVITNEYIFIESYPMIKVKSGQAPIGGSSPMIISRKDTSTYRIWKEHFEYVWNNQSCPCSDNNDLTMTKDKAANELIIY